MNYMITEVQITCIVLMGLMTFILAFALPRYCPVGKVLVRARNILIGGTTLLTIHFLIQYFLHKSETVSPELRTNINLFFGIPISCCFNVSLLYLQRKGNIKVMEYMFIPIVYVISILIFFISYSAFGYNTRSMNITSLIMSILYASTLLYANILQFTSYFRIQNDIRTGKDISLEPLVRWTKWCMFMMSVVSLGLPIMTFNTNLIMRSLYGIYSISMAFFYIFCFIGYYVNTSSLKVINVKIESENDKGNESTQEKHQIDDTKLKRVEIAIDEYVRTRHYLQAGITIKDVATEIGVSRNLLSAYFQTTEYKKFNNWLMVLRIEEAKRLLQEHSDWSNEAISQASGFSNRAYFQSQFSEYVGMSPLKWIKESQKVESPIQIDSEEIKD